MSTARKLATVTALPRTLIDASAEESARLAGLRYVSDDRPGYSRRRCGRKGFAFYDTTGRRIVDKNTIKRLQRLGIPPAWTGVWICPRADGHIQATGKDARGRKQYRYHTEWRRVRDEAKYHRMIAFGHALPALRARVAADMALPGIPRTKLLATVVRLLETTLIRVGNEEYARENNSFGLTTMRNRHVAVDGSRLRFAFKGKSGVKHAIDVRDRRIARIVRQLQELPGQELFQYDAGDGEFRSIDSSDVNEYLQAVTGQSFTAKDFRTWAGTVLAAKALQEFEAVDSQAQAKRNVMAAIESVAKRLGNTKTICRKCYVHPAVIEAYMDGTLVETLQQRSAALAFEASEMSPEEAMCLTFLIKRLQAER